MIKIGVNMYIWNTSDICWVVEGTSCIAARRRHGRVVGRTFAAYGPPVDCPVHKMVCMILQNRHRFS
jgi:hypothetical protein